MNANLERLLTIVTTAVVASAANYAGYGKDGSASKSAQDQCCPIARECVSGLVDAGNEP